MDLWLGPRSLTPSYNLDLKPLGPYKSEPLKKLKSSRLQMFFKIGSIKNFAIFTGKHLCWGLFLIKLQVLPVDIAKFLRIAFLCNTSGGCFWQSYHGTVKSAGVPVLWFRASTCFRFWSKTFTKSCTNNSLLSRDKTISSLLELISHVLSISEYVLETHSLLSILMKNLQKALHKQLCNIRCQKNFFPCRWRKRLVRCF